MKAPELFGNTFVELEFGLMCQWMVKDVQEGLLATDVYNSWMVDNSDEDILLDELGEDKIDTTPEDDSYPDGADLV